MTGAITPFRVKYVPGQPNEDIVADLENLLRLAKTGELQAFAYCTVQPKKKGSGWVGNHGMADSLTAALMMLNHRYAADMLGVDE